MIFDKRACFSKKWAMHNLLRSVIVFCCDCLTIHSTVVLYEKRGLFLEHVTF